MAAAVIATDAQLQPFVSAHGPPKAGGASLRPTNRPHKKAKALASSEGLSSSGPAKQSSPMPAHRRRTCSRAGAAAYQPADRA
ncbi:hypothetical protein DF153_18440 [Burkholderia cenocepacia]|nr:hypothetical protein DF152_19905 [Burkholderia cenocepacia]RQU23046.1 hypothetical protein DF153_18440 [Burkholderia cenocepacia]